MICFPEKRKYPRLTRSYPIKITKQTPERDRDVDATLAGGTTVNVSARGIYFVNYSYGEIFPGMLFNVVLAVPDSHTALSQVYPIELHGTARVIRVDNYFTEFHFSQKIALHLEAPLELEKPCMPREGVETEECNLNGV